jgi:hypothetical protein
MGGPASMYDTETSRSLHDYYLKSLEKDERKHLEKHAFAQKMCSLAESIPNALKTVKHTFQCSDKGWISKKYVQCAENTCNIGQETREA